jgi:PTH1 family peptidyl-tRNA hydrolase
VADRFLIIGLGNPGKKYSKNRHNAGFLALDGVASALGAGSFTKDKKGEWALAQGPEKSEIYFYKPLEFMNLSGNGVSLFLRKNGINPSELLVIHDEIDFEFAKCKMKIGGGHAGHNGLRDIIAKIGTADFHRLRVGVAKPSDGRVVADYVLSKFTSEEKSKLDEVYDLCLQKIQDWIKLT